MTPEPRQGKLVTATLFPPGNGVAVTCFLLLLAAVAAADPAPPSVTVPPVEVVGAPDAAAESTPATRVDDPSDLEAPGGPARALDRTPAAQVRQSGGPGQPVRLSVRGSDPQGTLTVLEDVPLNSPFLGGADLAGLSLLPLDSLEVRRGAASARHGSDAVGGVLRASLPDPLAPPLLRASLLAGSFGTVRLKAAAGGTTGPVGGLLSVGLLSSAGSFPFRDVNGAARTRGHAASLAAEGLARGGWEPAPGHRLDLLVEGAREDREVPGLEQYPSTTARATDDRFVLRLSWDGPRPFGRRGSSGATAWVRRLGFAFADRSPPLGPAVDTRLVAWGVGAEARAEAAPWELVAFRGAVSATWDAGDVRRLSQGAYRPRRTAVAGRAGVVAGRPGGWWGVEADVRAEWDAGFGVRALPRAGAWVRPWGPFKLAATVGRAFRLPTLEELYFDAGFVQGNPALQPEDALSWDVGAEASGPAWAVRAAYFENRVRNVILFVPRSAFLVRADNSGTAVVRGVEASAEGRWRWLFGRAAYTWMRTRAADTGRALPARPEHRVSGEAGVEVGPVRIGVMPSWQSAFWLDRYEGLSEGARFRLDARLEVRAGRSVTLALEGQNLTDDRTAVDDLQSPLPGLAVYGQVRVDL